MLPWLSGDWTSTSSNLASLKCQPSTFSMDTFSSLLLLLVPVSVIGESADTTVLTLSTFSHYPPCQSRRGNSALTHAHKFYNGRRKRLCDARSPPCSELFFIRIKQRFRFAKASCCFHVNRSTIGNPSALAAFYLTSTTGQTGYGAFVASVNAPNGFTVTFDAMLVGITSPPADGIMCLVHGQASPLPAATWPTFAKCANSPGGRACALHQIYRPPSCLLQLCGGRLGHLFFDRH